jgi:hypothetical protein
LLATNGFIGSGKRFLKCFALRVPKDKDLLFFRILLSNEIFPNEVRPTYVHFRTFVHFLKQFMLSGYTKQSTWPSRSKHERYKMRLYLRAVDIVQNEIRNNIPVTNIGKSTMIGLSAVSRIRINVIRHIMKKRRIYRYAALNK